jgi:hypothetical protein
MYGISNACAPEDIVYKQMPKIELRIRFTLFWPEDMDWTGPILIEFVPTTPPPEQLEEKG